MAVEWDSCLEWDFKGALNWLEDLAGLSWLIATSLQNFGWF